MAMKAHQEQTNSRGIKRDSALLADWARATRALCRSGQYRTELEGFRLNLHASHSRIIRPFESIRWIGWTIGDLCCRIAPLCAVAFFQADQKHSQKIRIGSRMVAIQGDEPVAIHLRSKGRLSLPAHITSILNILMDDKVVVLPRMGFIEIWLLSRWEPMFKTLTPASLESIQPEISIPISPASSRNNPICPSSQPQPVMLKSNQKKKASKTI